MSVRGGHGDSPTRARLTVEVPAGREQPAVGGPISPGTGGRELFARFDANQDGVIDREEFREAFLRQVDLGSASLRPRQVLAAYAPK